MASASHDGTDSLNTARSNTDRAKSSGDESRPAKPEANELEKARDSLRNVPELSEKRMVKIKDRIKRGYYSRSDVLDRIAKRLTHNLTQDESGAD